MPERLMLFVVSVFKGITLNKKIRLDHESLRHPETLSLKYHWYNTILTIKKSLKSLLISGLAVLGFSFTN